MPKAVTTQGQGADAFLTIPAISINAGTNLELSGIEVDVKPVAGSAAGFVNLLGISANNTTALRINTATQTLQWRSSSTVYLESSAGSAPLGERNKYGAEWEEVTLSLYLTKNGTRIAGPYTTTASSSTVNITWNQIGKVGATAPGGVMVFELYGIRSYGANCTYQSQWDDTGASGSGTSWANDANDRNLTLTSFTGAANSWWIDYGNTEEHTSTFSGSIIYSGPVPISTKEALKTKPDQSLVLSSARTPQKSGNGTFARSYSITSAWQQLKEATRIIASALTYTSLRSSIKEALSQKPTTPLVLTSSQPNATKESAVSKPNTQINISRSFTQTKSSEQAKPATTISLVFGNWAWSTGTGATGSFVSNLLMSSSISGSKGATASDMAWLLFLDSTQQGQKTAAAGFGGVISYAGYRDGVKEAHAAIISGATLTTEVISSKEGMGSWASDLEIDWAMRGTSKSQPPQIIEYATSVLSTLDYSTNNTNIMEVVYGGS